MTQTPQKNESAATDAAAARLRDGAEAARGASPVLTGGESSYGAQRAKVDWMTATFAIPAECYEAARDGETIEDANGFELLNGKAVEPSYVAMLMHSTINHWFGGCVFSEEVPGMLGYAYGLRFSLKLYGVDQLVYIGRIDYHGRSAGKANRVRLDITGAGCSALRHWDDVKAFLLAQVSCHLTRVDLAVDCLQGEFSVLDCRDWYLAGDFNCGGRPPRHSLVGDWLSEQPEYGRTLEVGRRENGKMLRCYEKGRQLGQPDSEWTRFEVELRNNDRELPFDMLTDCDSYFVGAYPALEKVLAASATRIATHQKEKTISKAKLIEYASLQYGRLLYVMQQEEEAERILDQISRPGVPRRLEKSLVGLKHAVPLAA